MLRRRPARLAALLGVPFVAAVLAAALTARGPQLVEVRTTFAVASPVAANSPVADRRAAEAVERSMRAGPATRAVADSLHLDAGALQRGLEASRIDTSVRVALTVALPPEEATAALRLLVAKAVEEVYADELGRRRAPLEGAEADRRRVADEVRAFEGSHLAVGVLTRWRDLNGRRATLRDQRTRAEAAGDAPAALRAQLGLDAVNAELAGLEPIAADLQRFDVELTRLGSVVEEARRRVAVIEDRGHTMVERAASASTTPAEVSPLVPVIQRAVTAAAIGLLLAAAGVLVVSVRADRPGRWPLGPAGRRSPTFGSRPPVVQHGS